VLRPPPAHEWELLPPASDGLPIPLTLASPKAVGNGAFGTVLAVRTRDGTQYALKVPIPGRGTDLVREAEVLAALPRHPALVPHPVWAHSVADGALGLAYPLYRGDLVGLFGPRRGPAPLASLRCVARDGVQALAHTHACGWAHCDVKLDNLLGNGDGEDGLDRFVLADWGGALPLDAHGRVALASAPRQYPGTQRYHAPELVAMAAGCGGRWSDLDLRPCDVYALGLTLLALGAGGMPRRTQDGSVEGLEALLARMGSALVQGLVRSMLCVDPGARPTAQDLVGHPFLLGAV
jgi:serine/threonine protein kinase